MPDYVISQDTLPRDGRFGSGPSKVPTDRLDALAATGTTLMGTSHRQAPVKALVRRVREGLGELLGLPDGHEVVLGNGGTHAFWDAAVLALVESRAQHVVLGEFGGKFADAVAAAPFLAAPSVRRAEPGTLLLPEAEEGVDTYAYVHNETSTGVMSPVRRVGDDAALVLVDATSGAGGLPVDVAETDAYYFAPQKCFASDGGLWVAVLSPAAVERAERLVRERWVPPSVDLVQAIESSRKDQTLNTPAVATLFLLAEQVDWMLAEGGLPEMVRRTTASSGVVHDWVRRTPYAAAYVTDPDARSLVVSTVDLDDTVDAAAVAAVLRANGVVDVEPYRKLGRNQLRIATFPSTDTSDVEALTACIDDVVAHLSSHGS